MKGKLGFVNCLVFNIPILARKSVHIVMGLMSCQMLRKGIYLCMSVWSRSKLLYYKSESLCYVSMLGLHDVCVIPNLIEWTIKDLVKYNYKMTIAYRQLRSCWSIQHADIDFLEFSNHNFFLKKNKSPQSTS